MASKLVQKVIDVLNKSRNVEIVDVNFDERSAYNLLLKTYLNDKSITIMLKVLENVDTLNKQEACDLLLLSNTTSAVPLITGYRSNKDILHKGVVYKRYGINVISIATLRDVLMKRKMPKYYSEKGGIYARIKGSKLRELREKYNLSLGDIALLLGTSRKTIYEYEREEIETTEIKAKKLEAIFGETIFETINIFDKKHLMDMMNKILMKEYEERHIFRKNDSLYNVYRMFKSQGYNVARLKRSSFNAVAYKKERGSSYNTKLSGYLIKILQGFQDVKAHIEKMKVLTDAFKTDIALIIQDKDREILNVVQCSK